jgi:hypothetical protein
MNQLRKNLILFHGAKPTKPPNRQYLATMTVAIERFVLLLLFLGTASAAFRFTALETDNHPCKPENLKVNCLFPELTRLERKLHDTKN